MMSDINTRNITDAKLSSLHIVLRVVPSVQEEACNMEHDQQSSQSSALALLPVSQNCNAV